MDLDHLIGCKKAVLDALLQRVGVNRLAEIVDVGDVFRFFRRCGEADLGRGGKIFKNLAPGGILGGAATVALINNDEVKEARREFPEELLPLFRPGDGLVKTKIDLIGRVDAALLVERGR